MEDWAEIRRLRRAEGMPIAVIARPLGVARNMVKKALASDRPPTHTDPGPGSRAKFKTSATSNAKPRHW